MFLILLFKLITQFPFVSFLSISISLCSLSQSSLFSLSLLPLHHPFFLISSILCPPKIKTSIYYILFTIFLHTVLHHELSFFFFNNAFYKLEKNTKYLCLSSNLSNPEDLKKQWLPFSILSHLPFLISPSLSSIPSCSSDQFSVLLR